MLSLSHSLLWNWLWTFFRRQSDSQRRNYFQLSYIAARSLCFSVRSSVLDERVAWAIDVDHEGSESAGTSHHVSLENGQGSVDVVLVGIRILNEVYRKNIKQQGQLSNLIRHTYSSFYINYYTYLGRRIWQPSRGPLRPKWRIGREGCYWKQRGSWTWAQPPRKCTKRSRSRLEANETDKRGQIKCTLLECFK